MAISIRKTKTTKQAMKNKIKVLGHEVEYECSDVRGADMYTVALIYKGVTNNEICGTVTHDYRLHPSSEQLSLTLTWRIVEPKVLEVSVGDVACFSCPLMSQDPSCWSCRHPDYKGGMQGDQSDVFEHCPLKKESITIKLKSDEQH